MQEKMQWMKYYLEYCKKQKNRLIVKSSWTEKIHSDFALW